MLKLERVTLSAAYEPYGDNIVQCYGSDCAYPTVQLFKLIKATLTLCDVN